LRSDLIDPTIAVHPPERRTDFRIGIHPDDVVEESDGERRRASSRSASQRN
jgi:hypothetical protein